MERKFTFLFIAILFQSLLGCKSNHLINGYVGAHSTLLSVPNPGQLIRLPIKEGQIVQKNAPLFAVDTTEHLLLTNIAKEKVRAETGILEDLKQGRRDTYLNVLKAKQDGARDTLKYAKKTYQRLHDLYNKKSISSKQFDEALEKYQQAQSLLKASEYTLAYAKLPAREYLIQAQKAKLNQATSEYLQQQWQTEQQIAIANHPGTILRTFYEPGEYVAPNTPIIEILYSGKKYIGFYLEAPAIKALKKSNAVMVRCAGCDRFEKAQIDSIAKDSSYIPKFLFSGQAPTHITVLVHVKIPEKSHYFWHPGQPVQIKLL